MKNHLAYRMEDCLSKEDWLSQPSQMDNSLFMKKSS